jgi:hypothetical protein
VAHATPEPRLSHAVISSSNREGVVDVAEIWKYAGEVFQQLDPTNSELVEVFELWEKGKKNEAIDQLVEFYKQQVPKRYCSRNANMDQVPSESMMLSRAEMTLTKHFVVLDREFQFEDGIDWFKRPFGDYEWTWLFNRHYHWDDLAFAYQVTHDEKYAEEFNEEVLSWVKSCPMPEKCDNRSMNWRTIEAGIRMGGGWPIAWKAFQHSVSFTSEARLAMIKSFAEHGAYLSAYPTGGNWLLLEMQGLASVGTLFPEFRSSKKWLEYAVDKMYLALKQQIYPDGMQFELTTHYHLVCIMCALKVAALVESSGKELPVEYYDLTSEMMQVLNKVAKPDGTIPLLNDSDRNTLQGSMQRLKILIEDSPAKGKLVSKFGFSEKIVPESTALKDSGLYIMRANDHYCLIDGGPFGAGHQHEDQLNMVVSAFGEEEIVDSGRYTYVLGKWRDYFVGSEGHNLICVDGYGQSRRFDRDTWASSSLYDDVVWQTNSDHDYFSGVYKYGFGNDPSHLVSATHRRDVLFVKPHYWVVVDTLMSEQEHTYSQLWHFAPGIPVLCDPGANCVRTNIGRNGLIVYSLSEKDIATEIIVGRADPIQGWYSPRYNIKVPAACAVFTGVEKDMQFITILAPALQDRTLEETLSVSVRGEASKVLRLDIETSGAANVLEVRRHEALEQSKPMIRLVTFV